MARFFQTTALLAFVSVAMAYVAPSNKAIQFNNEGYPTPGPCMGVSSTAVGQPAVVLDCGPNDGAKLSNPLARTWIASPANPGPHAPRVIAAYGNLCLDVKDGKNADGTTVQAYTCNRGNANQQWNINVDLSITWYKDSSKCLDVDTRHGTGLVINTCVSGNPYQKWNANDVVGWPAAPKGSPVQFQINDHLDQANDSTGSCISVNGNIANGAAVNVQPCSSVPAGSRSWTVTNGGSATGAGPSSPITVGDGYCVDVKDSADQDGTKLQIWKCYPGSKNQQFQVNGDGSIKWAGGNNKCVDLTGGDEAGHAQLQIWTCSASNYNQKWIPFPVST